MSLAPNQSFAAPGRPLFYSTNTPLPAGPTGTAGSTGPTGPTGPTVAIPASPISGQFCIPTVTTPIDTAEGGSSILIFAFNQQVTNGISYSFPNWTGPAGTYLITMSGQVSAATAGRNLRIYATPGVFDDPSFYRDLITTTTITATTGTAFSSQVLLTAPDGLLNIVQTLSGSGTVNVTYNNLTITITKVA